MRRDEAGMLATAVRSNEEFEKVDFWAAAKLATDMRAAGCVVAWLLANAGEVATAKANARFYFNIFGPVEWLRAGRKGRALPLRLGELDKLHTKLKTEPLSVASGADFAADWGRQAWIYTCLFAVNSMYGVNGRILEGKWTKLERRAAEAIGSSVDRLLAHGQVKVPADDAMIAQLKKRRVNYKGEEVGVCHRLSLAQVLPALPPADHGGAVEAVEYVSTHTRELLMNPGLSILEDDGRPLPKMQGIVHADPQEMNLIAEELVKRGVCKWIRRDTVYTYRGQAILNGLFGVEKPSTLSDGRPILRLIMNLVSTNAVLRQFKGATQNLPAITSWMSTVANQDEEIQFWQSDMSNAFYLFKIPDAWGPLLSFNVHSTIRDPLSGESVPAVLSCRVLPMGWLSSVAVMQEISEKILLQRGLPVDAQVTRCKPLPRWMVGILDEANKHKRVWWHVYLDNFAAGQVCEHKCDLVAGDAVHELAELAWSEAGIISSAKKRKSRKTEIEELGAFLDGKVGYLGGSSERFLKLIHATFWVLAQPLLSKKLVQIIAGRWVHVMQFRRPTMSFLEHTWKYIGDKKLNQGIQSCVRRELFACVAAIPLMHTNLRATISPVTTASDASSKGGAVGMSAELTEVGMDYVRGIQPRLEAITHAPILVISLFGGIGGSFRAYDLLGIEPCGLVHFDIHAPANRVTSKRWPRAEMYLDVRDFTKAFFKELLARYLGTEEIHLWAGFPCTDLALLMQLDKV